MIYNTTTHAMEYYNGSAWVSMGGAAPGHIGAPAYDSGWIFYNVGPNSLVLNHNLGTNNTMVDVEFEPANDVDWPRINNFSPEGVSGDLGNFLGWIDKTSNQISIRSTAFTGTHQKRVRVRMWRTD